MELTEAIQVAERLEREDCIGTTSQALRSLLRGYNDLLGPVTGEYDRGFGDGMDNNYRP
jgi:hypothetical protein